MESNEIHPDCPKYRVRLFLSVDLTNSTSFKSSRPPHTWVPIFRDFYSQFTEKFQRSYISEIEKAQANDDHLSDTVCDNLKSRKPKFWKTVGDEILFVNRVDSCYEVFLLVGAFSETLKEYGKTLSSEAHTETLGVKGAGWLASFPYPNIAIEMPRETASKESGLSEREAIEESADRDPSQHEFLGKGLDYGFRIAGNSSNDFFAVSPGLADIISRANVNEDYANLGVRIKVRSPIKLKGVLDGRDYPVVGIPIDSSKQWSDYRRLQDKLLGTDQTNNQDLRDYFRHFMELHNIEQPTLPVRPEDKKLAAPSYYLNKYVPKWMEAQKEVTDQDTMIKEGDTIGEADGDVPDEKTFSEAVRQFSSMIEKYKNS